MRLIFGRVFLVCIFVLATGTVAMADTSATDTVGPVVPEGTCPTGACPATPPTVINGTLGSCGDWPACTSGVQTGRLNRNGIFSTCAVPKACDIFLTDPGRAFDAYTISNGTGATACVAVELNTITQTACNLQVNAYLNTYDPANICTNYLADPGMSSGSPPNPFSFCFDVPDGNDLVLVVHTTNPGEIGCEYQLVMSGDCIPVELMEFSVD